MPYFDEAGALVLADAGQAGAEGAIAILGVVDGHAEGPPVLRRVARGPGSQRCRTLKKQLNPSLAGCQ